MIKSISYKTKQFFFVLIKISIVVLAFYFIHNKLTTNTELNFHQFIELLNKNQFLSTKHILILLTLSTINWSLEILKWKTLISNLKSISFKNALKQSLGSLTASLFTPNRIGEYGAKAMYFSNDLRKQVMGVNLISNLLQMFVTAIFGIIGTSYFVLNYPIEVNYVKLGITCLILIIVLVFIIVGVKNNLFEFKYFSLKRNKKKLSKLSRTSMYWGVTYSVSRYIVFSFQFYLLLLFFSININYFDAIMIISTMYLVASVIPSIFIFDVLVKGSIAVYLFSFLNIEPVTILAIISLMWIFNFVVPSVIGSYFVLNYKLPNKSN